MQNLLNSAEFRLASFWKERNVSSTEEVKVLGSASRRWRNLVQPQDLHRCEVLDWLAALLQTLKCCAAKLCSLHLSPVGNVSWPSSIICKIYQTITALEKMRCFPVLSASLLLFILTVLGTWCLEVCMEVWMELILGIIALYYCINVGIWVL